MRGGAACALIVLLSQSGCAAILRGSTQPVEFRSEPPGAQVAVQSKKGDLTCSTPCTLKVPRSVTPASYTIELPGREPVSEELIPVEEWNAKWLLPVVFDSLLIVPGIIDLTSECLWNWPTGVRATLPESGQGAPRVKVDR